MSRHRSRPMFDQSMTAASSSSAIELASPWAHTNGRPPPPSSRTASSMPLLSERLIAQIPLEDLARGVAWKLVFPEPHLHGDLERGKPVAHVSLKVLLGRGSAVS